MSVIKSQNPGFPAGGSLLISVFWLSLAYMFCRSWLEMKGIILNWAWLILNFLLSRSVIVSQFFSSMSLQLEFLMVLRVSSFSTGRSSSCFCSRSSEAWKQVPVLFMVIP